MCFVDLIGFVFQKLISCTDIYRINQYYKKIKGNGFVLGRKVYISNSQNVSIGEGTYINGGDVYASPNARIIIGRNCLISCFCQNG